MTEANKASCRCEGEKADFEIEDFWLFWVADDAVEAAPREVFLLMMSESGQACALRLRRSRLEKGLWRCKEVALSSCNFPGTNYAEVLAGKHSRIH
jgi:hypothetical protein